MTRVRQALILVGGKGTRLGDLTAATPKPLLEIGPGVPFLDRLIDEVARQGFDDILLLAGHLGEQVEARYQGACRRDARVTVIRESEPLGTGGALSLAAPCLAETFLMLNGDSIFDINLRALAAEPLGDAIGRIALREIDDVSRYGAVETRGGQITAFREKAALAPAPGTISGGVYLLSREVLEWIESTPCSIETDVFPLLAQEGRLQGRPFEGYFIDIGLPASLAEARRDWAAKRGRPAAFLDRDGVLNVDKGYTHRVKDLRWTPDAREAVRALNDAGRLVVVVTNQSGIGRGLYSEADMARFHQAMRADLAAVGAHIDAFYHCPFHRDAALPEFRADNHPDRKPNPGMLQRAISEWDIYPNESFLIGDKMSDIEAARRVGVRGFLFNGGSLLDVVRQGLATPRHAEAET
jgi:D-glycero-D-manno-heptose 1,7-bisphosphate phosphatase